MYDQARRLIDVAIGKLEAEIRLVKGEIKRLQDTQKVLTTQSKVVYRAKKAAKKAGRKAAKKAKVRVLRGRKPAAKAAKPKIPGKPGRKSVVKGVDERSSNKMISAWKAYQARKKAGT